MRRRARRRARPRGADLPLAGVPFAVKDNIDVAGVATTAGCAEFAYVPERSAPVVERSSRAGARLRRQDQPRPVRHRPRRHAVARYGACRNPLDPDTDRRRLELRLGDRGRHRRGAVRARHRHRRLRRVPAALATASSALKPTRGPAPHARRGAGVRVARLRVGVHRAPSARRRDLRRLSAHPAAGPARAARARRRSRRRSTGTATTTLARASNAVRRGTWSTVG